MLTGIDVGATSIKAGLVTTDGDVVEERTVSLTPSDYSEHGIVDRISAVVDALGPSDGVGVGVAGVLRHSDGCITTSPNFPKWRDFMIVDRLQARLQRPVTVDNDANCVIRGEAVAGVAQGESNLVGLTLGTGVGGAVILGGRVWRGVDGMAGELGHMVVEPDGPDCGCGSNGCMEMYASAVGLRWMCTTYPVAGLTQDDLESSDLPRILCELADAGNESAKERFHTSGRAIGRVLAGVLNALNVKTVVLAGGMAAAHHWMTDAIHSEIKHRAFAAISENVRILIGTLGKRAGVIGAAAAVDTTEEVGKGAQR
jgi:glucokinase